MIGAGYVRLQLSMAPVIACTSTGVLCMLLLLAVLELSLSPASAPMLYTSERYLSELLVL